MTSERSLPDSWRWVRFGDVVRQVKQTTKDPGSDGLTRIVGLEHLDSESLPLRRWHELADLPDRTSFTRIFRAGQVLFGKRRAYQRKVAVADFDGVCSGDILVFEPSTDELLPEFLPYVVQSDGFFDHALGTSAGSLSPRTKWQELAKYEFALPSLNGQKRIADAIRRADQQSDSLERVRACADDLLEAMSHHLFTEPDGWDLAALADLVDKPICYGVLKPGPEYAGGVRCIDVKDYPNGVLDPGSVRMIDPTIDAEFERSRLSAGDLLVSIRGTIGRVAVVPSALEGANISRDSARLSITERAEPEFVRLVLEGTDAQQQMRGKVVGLAVKGINIADLRRVRIPLPPIDRQRELSDRALAARKLRFAADCQVSHATHLRRCLVEELLHGGLNV